MANKRKRWIPNDGDEVLEFFIVCNTLMGILWFTFHFEFGLAFSISVLLILYIYFIIGNRLEQYRSKRHKK